MVLGSTHPLTEMNTWNTSWGVKAAGKLGTQPCHFHVLIVMKTESLNITEPSGPVQACIGIALCLHAVIDSSSGSAVLLAVTIQGQIYDLC